MIFTAFSIIMIIATITALNLLLLTFYITTRTLWQILSTPKKWEHPPTDKYQNKLHLNETESVSYLSQIAQDTEMLRPAYRVQDIVSVSIHDD